MNKTLVISVDGLRSEDYADSRIRLERLRETANRGWSYAKAHTVFPSVTWAIHPSVLAGRSPRATGCLGNTVYDRKAGRLVHGYDPEAFSFDRDIQSDTLIDAFSRSGFRVGSVCWPLTQGATALACNVPEFYSQSHFDEHTTPSIKADLLNRGFPFERYGEWSAEHAMNPLQDTLTRDICLNLIKEDRVDVLFTHFLTIDSLQHDFGVQSPEAYWAMEFIDGLAGSLIDAAAGWDIVIFSDHGHAPVSHAFYIDQWLAGWNRNRATGESPVVAASNGGACFLYHVPDAAQDPLKKSLSAHEAVSEVWFRDSFQALGLPDSDKGERGLLPDLIFEAKEGWYVANGGDAGITTGTGPMKGMHGYRPSRAGIDGFMLFAGPSFEGHREIAEGSLLDIAPTLSSVNSLSMENLDGVDLGDAAGRYDQ